MKPLSKEVKTRLGILWVLLNVSTEYQGDNSVVVRVMRMIEKACPEARRMWSRKFEIVIDGKTVFSWNNGSYSDGGK